MENLQRGKQMRTAVLIIACTVCANCPADVTVRSVPLSTSQLAVDPIAGTIYGTDWNSGTVTPLNPTTGTLGTPIPVGLNPNKMAISGNGQYLYVGLNGANAVRRVDLATQTAGLQFSLGVVDILGNPTYPEDIVVMPGAPQTIAVSCASH